MRISEFLQNALSKTLLNISGHDVVQLGNVPHKVLLAVRLAQSLLKLFGLPLQAGEDNERGHHQDHRPHTEQDHRHIPDIVFRSNRAEIGEQRLLINSQPELKKDRNETIIPYL